jgi:hypothetical protein
VSKQTTLINKQCQHKSQCFRDAVIGVYEWRTGETDVNLNAPVKVYCGQHKPRVHRGQNLRIVSLK